ncbi:MAG TPA: class I SAM-dependent methyltransferase [Pyrinomonadaceae bacterium]|jgi:SAM-dependent methyltransferase
MADNNQPSPDKDFVDVRTLLEQRSLEQLNQLAEEYFARLTTRDYHLAKPFGAIDETPQLLINFAVVLQGLALCPGLTVLEFGAGTCWAARYLSQLGCQVIALDVSPTALDIGQELYRHHPVIGNKPAARFLQYDGLRIDLPDESVDRIICLDAFHHVPNPGQVLREMGRVLKNGGIAGFAEPGPEHSQSAQSQYEMRTFGVIENDVKIREIWRDARLAHFTDIKVAVFNVPPFHLSLDDFEAFLNDEPITAVYVLATREFLKNQRNFFLYKGPPAASDSRFRAGLQAEIRITSNNLSAIEGETIVARATVTNTSNSVWLPRSAQLGAVMLGVHVYHADETIHRHSFHWEALTEGEGRPIRPNESVDVEIRMPPLPKGDYILEFDMVSNDVCWFSLNGSPTVRVPLEVQ